MFVEAVLTLLSALVGTGPGCTAMSQASVIPALLPLLKACSSDFLYARFGRPVCTCSLCRCQVHADAESTHMFQVSSRCCGVMKR